MIEKQIFVRGIAASANRHGLAPEIQTKIVDRIAPDKFDYISNLSDKYRYLFVNVPKAASTSLLGILQRAENADMAKEMSSVHDRDKSPLPSMAQYTFSNQLKILEGNGYLRFSFVRNPLSRLLSAYLSKIDKPLAGWRVDPSNPNNRPPKACILARINGTDIVDIFDMSQRVKFPEFVKIVCEQQVIDMDLHWKPQTDLLLSNQIDYDFIGNLESFATDFIRLVELLNIENVQIPAHSANRTSSDERLDAFYTPELKQMVYNKFYDDFNRYEYSVSGVSRVAA